MRFLRLSCNLLATSASPAGLPKLNTRTSKSPSQSNRSSTPSEPTRHSERSEESPPAPPRKSNSHTPCAAKSRSRLPDGTSQAILAPQTNARGGALRHQFGHGAIICYHPPLERTPSHSLALWERRPRSPLPLGEGAFNFYTANALHAPIQTSAQGNQ